LQRGQLAFMPDVHLFDVGIHMGPKHDRVAALRL